MMRTAPLLLLLVAACATTPGTAAPTTPTQPSSACATAEHRGFDFWIGTWDLVVLSRTDSTAAWTKETGTQRIESILGGCVISESFTADGSATPWAGKSFSMWQPALGHWRQTWIDDQGSFIALTGGVEDGVMTLYGEPVESDGKLVEKRMVFLDVTANALRWEWQRKQDDGTWVAQMVIEYRRAD